jgi:hypothetical protein
MIEADIKLSNPTKPELQPLAVRAMVDTGESTKSQYPLGFGQMSPAKVKGRSLLVGPVASGYLDSAGNP